NRRRIHHVDGVPRTPALAQRTADATLQVNVHERLQARLVLAGHLVNAVHRTDLNARFAARAVVRPHPGELLGELFARLACTLRHDDTLVPGWISRLKSRPERLPGPLLIVKTFRREASLNPIARAAPRSASPVPRRNAVAPYGRDTSFPTA